MKRNIPPNYYSPGTQQNITSTSNDFSSNDSVLSKLARMIGKMLQLRQSSIRGTVSSLSLP